MSNLKVFKYPVDVDDFLTVPMPLGAELLTVQMQGPHGDTPCVWAIVDPAAPMVVRRFAWRGTGHDLGIACSLGNYVGTVQAHGGRLVFHLFDLGCE